MVDRGLEQHFFKFIFSEVESCEVLNHLVFIFAQLLQFKMC